MDDFARATGLEGGGAPRRYLWTDAFAVCNFLGLHRDAREARFLDLAVALVDQVHHVLARYRGDDARTGWISGMSEADGERHPTKGGLRIGKPLPERRPDEPVDEDLEWERDGQYFHYLTKWMHALQRVSEETGEARYHEWAVELARVAHAAFQVAPGRMAWKMSVDLSRPLVASMGHHDPLDALVSYLALEAGGSSGSLAREVAEASAIAAGRSWATADPLGIGGLLCDAARLAGMVARGASEWRELLLQLVEESLASLTVFERSGLLAHPTSRRLAFRELGLSIGLHAIDDAAPSMAGDSELRPLLREASAWQALADEIERTWSDPRARRGSPWTEHGDINAVMLATSLHPRGFLGPTPRADRQRP
jgi:hypothetical protein